jgi:hypothetical protein
MRQPQPLKLRRAPKHFTYSPQAFATQRPELAARIASLISRWAASEGLVTLLLTALLGGSGRAAASILSPINSFPLRVQVVLSVCEGEAQEKLARVRDVLELASRVSRHRNTLAHSRWGVSDDFPDSVLCIDPALLWGRFAGKIRGDWPDPDGLTDDAWQDSFAWRRRDFDAIDLQFHEVERKLMEVLVYVVVS